MSGVSKTAYGACCIAHGLNTAKETRHDERSHRRALRRLI